MHTLDKSPCWGYFGGMGSRKIKTQYPGVRYYEHSSRKLRSGQLDRYYSIRFSLDGRVVEECLGWASEGWNPEKAHAVLAGLKNAARTGDGPRTLAEVRAKSEAARQAEAAADARAKADGLTLAEFFDRHYLPRAQKDKSSWKHDLRRFKSKVEPALGALPLKAVTKAHVQEFIDELAGSGLAPATVRHYQAIIRRAFNLATQTMVEGEAAFSGLNPTAGLRAPEVRNARVRFLSGAEAERLIQESAASRQPDLQDAVILSLNTGLRLGEIAHLSWPDINFSGGFITVRDEASRKPGGTVPMNPAVLEMLKKRRQLDKSVGSVFQAESPDHFRDNISVAFRGLVERLGFNEGLKRDDRQRRIVFHTLRHTFASWLACAGVDIYRIKTLMRHKTMAMTMRYAHLIPDATRDAVHSLAPPKDLSN